ncbi:hypothetical protein [Paraburkholderia unamae]|uniref:Uncharacterized protein n=1 Tax=Paraburkholderia unamae TaxID=219649 RepID=A0ABX5KYA7_9BURK|nr:hypothetical protein [Paraburkholderia unamae]PVX86427.1 hypothetical protein C7402_102263 [Paraburkholderia unamae]
MNERTIYIGTQEYKVTAVSSGLGRWIARIVHTDHAASPNTMEVADIQGEYGTVEETLDSGIQLCKHMAHRFALH